MQKVGELGKKRKTLFVQVYDELYRLIMDGTYPEGSMLPSEATLVDTLQVSRVTVRQAIALLQEDGLVKSIKGKGTIVCSTVQKHPYGMEKMANPVHACYRSKPDDIEVTTKVSLVTGYLKKKFQDKCLAVMVVERLYKQEQKLMVYALSYIPVEAADHIGLDLSIQDDVVDFLEKGVYETAKYNMVNIIITDTIEFVTKRENFDLNGEVLLYTEDIYFSEDYPYVHSKYYFVSSDYRIQFNAKQ